MPRRPRVRRVAARLGVATLALTLVLSATACAPEATIERPGPAQVDAALPTDMRQQMQAATEEVMAATGSPGAIVGVWVPWAGTWVEAFGTNTPGGAAVTVDHRFTTGYATRAMVCDVLYALVERGVVALGDTVGDWLPEYPNAAELTLGQLCDGTSGLDIYSTQLDDRWFANPERVWNAREIAAYGLSLPRRFAPGTAFRDSDTGYILLGLALERAAGAPIEELLEDHVFRPLGLTTMSLPETAQLDGPRLSGLRSGTVDGQVDCAAPVDLTALSPTALHTAGGVVGDVADLGAYVQALALGSRSYDPDDRFADAFSISGSSAAWFAADGGAYLAGSLVGQYGKVPGYLTAAFADRETGMAVVAVVNNSRGSAALVRDLAWKLAAIASKAPAADGQTAPEAGLPWTAETFDEAITKAAICPVE